MLTLGMAAILLAACGARSGAGGSARSAPGTGSGAESGAAATAPASLPSTAAPSHGPLPTFDAGDLASIDDALQATAGGLGSAASGGTEGNLK